MINFALKNMPDIIFGQQTEARCGELLKEAGGKKVLIHHSGEPFVLPLIERVKSYLAAAGLEWVELGGVVPNPSLSKVYEGVELCRRENVNCILAVGGGSVIDSAKGIGLGARYEGDVWDFYIGKAKPQSMLLLGVISTFAGTGSEWSQASVITNEKLDEKKSVDDYPFIRPHFAIMNPELTVSVPPLQTASGAADILSHLIENYCTATKDVYMNHQFLAAGMKTVLKHAPVAVHHPDDYAARSALMIVAPYAISGLLRIGLVGDWGCHIMEHEMSTEWNLPHGLGLAIVTPVWMRYVCSRNPQMFAKLAVDAFNLEYDFDYPERTAIRGIEMLEEFFHSLGLPDKVSKYVPDGDFSAAAIERMIGRIGFRLDGGTATGLTFRLTRDDVRKIYQAVL